MVAVEIFCVVALGKDWFVVAPDVDQYGYADGGGADKVDDPLGGSPGLPKHVCE